MTTTTDCRSVVAIDASRNRSGGAVAHLVGLLTGVDPREHGIREVHLWSYASLLSAIPDADWLVKHCPAALAGSLSRQLWWQYRHLPSEIMKSGGDVLLTTDAGSVCRYEPSVVVSQDMLAFEPGEMRRYAVSRAWTRLVTLRYVQLNALEHGTGTIFLSKHAASAIQRLSGPLPNVRIIPHGVSDDFRRLRANRVWPRPGTPIRCIYVSNIDLYKHQWHVVTAIARLRQAGHPVTLTLVGAGEAGAQELLLDVVSRADPGREFVTWVGRVPHSQIPEFLAQADIFLFASSCENLPNTLMEGMAAGLPIACSARGPMPEVLREGGTYFDPEEPASIAAAVEALIVDDELRADKVAIAGAIADEFTWRRCASETWTFLREVAVARRSSHPAREALAGMRVGVTAREGGRGFVVGIDASRNRSGGAVAHLLGLLTGVDPRDHGIREVHLWSYASLLSAIPDADWLVKHCPPSLSRSLPRQLWWQYRVLPSELMHAGCDVLLSTDAGSVCRHQPSVVMSRDMLSFEPGAMDRYPISRAWMRLVALRYVQLHALKHATGAIFLTRYAADVIQRLSGALPSSRIIPHGVTDAFRERRARPWPDAGKPIRCIYVSNIDLYKHQWNVVTAIARIRDAGYDVTLTLVGAAGAGDAKLGAVVSDVDPQGAFVTRTGGVPHNSLPDFLSQADIFVFASSCENMPNTLLEGMAAGLPIACSARGPMPEVLEGGGIYFDPENPDSIAAAIESLILDDQLRAEKVAIATAAVEQFTWQRCATDTWAFLREVAQSHTPSVR